MRFDSHTMADRFAQNASPNANSGDMKSFHNKLFISAILNMMPANCEFKMKDIMI